MCGALDLLLKKQGKLNGALLHFMWRMLHGPKAICMLCI